MAVHQFESQVDLLMLMVTKAFHKKVQVLPINEGILYGCLTILKYSSSMKRSSDWMEI